MEMTLIQELPSAAAVAVEFAALFVMIYWRQDFYLWADNQWSRIDDGWVASHVRK